MRLASRAEQLGIGNAVEITGHVDNREYQRRLEGAWCAVQLRHASADGGGSAAVNDALGAGLPVITNIASCRELPPDTVQLLPPEAAPRELAAEILRVLEHDDLRHHLGERALEYALTWSFEGLTTRLLEIIDSGTAARWQPQPKTA